MKSYSIVNKTEFDGLKEDIKGSIASTIDQLFETAHMVTINEYNGQTFIHFKSVKDGAEVTETVWIDPILFKEK